MPRLKLLRIMISYCSILEACALISRNQRFLLRALRRLKVNDSRNLMFLLRQRLLRLSVLVVAPSIVTQALDAPFAERTVCDAIAGLYKSLPKHLLEPAWIQALSLPYS
jgi:hypothetical protein